MVSSAPPAPIHNSVISCSDRVLLLAAGAPAQTRIKHARVKKLQSAFDFLNPLSLFISVFSPIN
jgi:hypothetical protein